jgi:hypothetical protein
MAFVKRRLGVALVRRSVVLIHALLLPGCGVWPAEPTPAIRFEASDLVLTPCESKQLNPAVTGLASSVLNWTSSEPATVEISSQGIATARMPGSATITATSQADTTIKARLTVMVRADLRSSEVGGSATDTIDALVPGPLFAVAHWAPSCPAAGVALRFSSPSVTIGPNSMVQPAVRLGEVGSEPAASIVQVVTDSTGRAAASARLGQRTGTYAVSVKDLAGDFSESIAMSVGPGAPNVIEASPRDTAVHVGATYPMRQIQIRDRGWNALQRVSPLESDDSATATVVSGVVRGESPGRAHILYEGVLVGSVSVVPNGRIAVARMVEHSMIKPAVVLMNLDGSASKIIYESARTGFNVATAPTWRPDGSELVLSDAAPGSTSIRLLISDTAGNARPVLADEYESDQHSGTYSPDGAWVYFGFGWSELIRAPATGGGSPEFVASVEFDAVSIAASGSKPSFSANGQHIVLHDVNRQVIRIDLATRQVLPLGIRGYFPAWSPREDVLAYIADGVVWLAEPDGTNRRRLTEDYTQQYGQGLSWSPDGRWLATRALATGHIHLVNAESGVALPLTFTAGLGHPVWEP